MIKFSELKEGEFEYPDEPRSFAWRLAHDTVRTRVFGEWDSNMKTMSVEDYYIRYADTFLDDSYKVVRRQYRGFSQVNIVKMVEVL